MTDTCGLTSCEPFAKWDRDSQSWKTSEATSLWALTLSSLTLPTWGGLHDGELCEHPTPELHTSGPDYSSLPTPTVDDASNITRASGCYNSLTRMATTMLPTPTAIDANVWGDFRSTGHQQTLPRVIHALLPTPAVNDMGEGKTLEWWDDWAPRQKAADGRPAPHGRSLAIEAQRMLPTPRAQDEYERRNMKTMERIRDEGGDMTLPTWAKVVAPLWPTPAAADGMGGHMNRSGNRKHEQLLPGIVRTFGATTAPPSTDGNVSLDDRPHRQLSLDELAHPA